MTLSEFHIETVDGRVVGRVILTDEAREAIESDYTTVVLSPIVSVGDSTQLRGFSFSVLPASART